MRTVKEWVGKSDDHMPPARIRQRILERENHTCHLCKGAIDRSGWHADHVPPLKDGGENREGAIKPAHAVCHRRETARQAAERAPVERKKQKHSGAIRPKQKLKGQGFARSEKAAKRESKRTLAPRNIYQQRG